ncbi:uncharacterized protein EI97DRAFT_454129 [Westerdykella ornata]|uniref:Diphthamide biosynthesis protein 4 n=1 Tax=Westerdykella ornata TaxID=318751 RepID=A0A6A6JXH5_WESOR|nr:uncharacterized protein EI97DRAFT_454129 [Westerdykella ornata]KAF2280894.1 hypothetical protein EI97DRAFT_454129 [Westerdykella ornata]
MAPFFPHTRQSNTYNNDSSNAFDASKPYYRILGLPEPPTTRVASGNAYAPARARISLDEKQIKAAYRAALLRAHPDKQRTSFTSTSTSTSTCTSTSASGGNDIKPEGGGGGRRDISERGSGSKNGLMFFTIDDVKEAYGVLGDEARRRGYDAWLARQRLLSSRRGGGGREREEDGDGDVDEDFVLGLEVWDLSDFVEGEVDVEGQVGGTVESESTSPSTSPSSPSSSSASPSSSPPPSSSPDASEPTQTKKETTWTHPCRCGSAPGFQIRESALEDAAARGETEVLVGCGGCSLWVRVGFGVEEG